MRTGQHIANGRQKRAFETLVRIYPDFFYCVLRMLLTRRSAHSVSFRRCDAQMAGCSKMESVSDAPLAGTVMIHSSAHLSLVLLAKKCTSRSQFWILSDGRVHQQAAREKLFRASTDCTSRCEGHQQGKLFRAKCMQAEIHQLHGIGDGCASSENVVCASWLIYGQKWRRHLGKGRWAIFVRSA